MTRVAVIGAGLAGLSAACHLRGRGHDVVLLEREAIPGGRSGRVSRAGYTFDTGPTVMTMPDLVQDALHAAGSSLEELLPMRRIDPGYRARFADGSEIMVRFGHDAMREEIARTCGSLDAAAFDEFVPWLRKLYRTEMPNFIDKNFDSPLDLLSAPVAAARLVALGGFGRLGPRIRRWFRDERLHRLFTFQAMYAGLPPESALVIYAVITYMDSIEGVWFPEGGMGAIPVAMATAAQRAGVDIRYNSTVERIVRSGGQDSPVTGVVLQGGERIDADALVCTLDLPVAYEKLLPELEAPRAVRKGTYSPSAVVWHVGANGMPAEGIHHHNIHFGKEWNPAFDALMKRGTLMPDPSRLVCVPSLSEPSLAAPGGSTLYVLEPVPHLGGKVDWTREAEPMRERLRTFLAAEGYPTDVVAEEYFTPLDWRRLGMAQGTPFALAHTFAQTGPFRPSNVERRVPGLFFAGSSTIPGVGVPMVLVSGKLAADRVDSYRARSAAGGR
ncbi:phytoene desaturase family protein [Gephyromycinifex aptenodytis]|uniref:phytoene desaturase family protein n=1 Tax=Gephyromycinifex aptenodytis TaxID=2716227 RepID=UPI001447DB00|nr:phytoene desaturase family protein [Gephyromycinifex aptenodytis]